MKIITKAFQAKMAPHTPKYKFGIQVPQGIRAAMELDRINGDGLWKEAINEELKQINDYKTFRQLNQNESLLDFKRIPYHIVFDVKFD